MATPQKPCLIFLYHFFSSLNSNKVIFNAWYYGREVSGVTYPWCSVFVAWCFGKAGLWGLAHGSLSAAKKVYIEGARQWKALATAKGQWVTAGYKPGDIVLFAWNKDGNINHVGVVEAVSIDGKMLTTIEGNTAAGNDSNGGEVQRRARKVDATVVGAFRPKYDAAADTKAPEAATPGAAAASAAVAVFSEKVQAGSAVTIRPGAKYGGLGESKGNPVPAAQLTPKRHTVSLVKNQNGRDEALLKEIFSWVAVSDLTLM